MERFVMEPAFLMSAFAGTAKKTPALTGGVRAGVFRDACGLSGPEQKPFEILFCAATIQILFEAFHGCPLFP
jgi:hypothetical protein